MAVGDAVSLAGKSGRVVAEGVTDGAGQVALSSGDLAAQATVVKCAGPDVALAGASVALVAEVDGAGQPVGRAAVMVDDEWWGRRIQPAEFVAGTISERFVMGYRLRGRILHNGVPQADANVSLEGMLATEEDGRVIFWDSEEYNELVYSQVLNTWIEGPVVRAPLRTDNEGRWEVTVPRGHGALYQRAGDLRDDSDETRARGLKRHLARVSAVYKGRKVEVAEGTEVVIDILSGRLRIVGTPGAYVRVSTLDDIGQLCQVPQDGILEVGGLPGGEHSVVQFRLTAWGSWDSAYGCARATAEVREGATVGVSLPTMEDYSSATDLLCGRVYERMGVPASGVGIVAVNFESGQVIGTVAATDGSGHWEVTLPPEGLGGDLWILDGKWGCVPILGAPYSDVVLGARMFASWADEFRPRAWRKGDRGHDNFSVVDGSVVVVDEATSEKFATEATPYGGWVTTEALPKYAYVADVATLLNTGPHLKTYALQFDGEVVEQGVPLRTQPFEGQESLPGQYRASGYSPEY